MTGALSPEDEALWRHVSMSVRPLQVSPRKFSKIQTENMSAGKYPPAQNKSRATRRGRVVIDMRIDLHDMTRQRALPFLHGRLTSAHERGLRCVLVITGKGPRLSGVLRAHLPGWLAAPNIRPIIASYAPAHIRHGGAGAFYVMLKSKRVHE